MIWQPVTVVAACVLRVSKLVLEALPDGVMGECVYRDEPPAAGL